MESLLGFLGRLHPVLVHFPIGILFLAFVFEVASRFPPYRSLGPAVQPTLLLGTLSAVVAAITGYLLSGEGGYPDRLLSLHKLSGISTAALSCILTILLGGYVKAWRIQVPNVRLLLFLPVVLALTITGHLGGSITHGEDYLFARADSAIPKDLRIETTQADTLPFYGAVVLPILERRCYDCHSSRKIKGELRLDEVDLMLNGGKDGKVILPGNADSSLILRRLMLPIEDEHHMPPEEKQQLSAAEIDLIRLWIDEGVPIDRKVGQLVRAPQASKLIGLLASNTPPDWIPTAPAPSPDAVAMEQLSGAGAVIVPVAEGSNYLSVNLSGLRTSVPQSMTALSAIGRQVVRLRLSYTPTGDTIAPVLAQLQNLAILYLDHTQIGDATMRAISPLPNLQYVNVVGSLVTDEALTALAACKRLKEFYCYDTSLSPGGLAGLQERLPSLQIDTGGYELPFLSTDTLVYNAKRQ